MAKVNVGEKYGRLLVLREVSKEERVNPNGRNYECLCDCGNKIILWGRYLIRGSTKSCGCLSRETASKNNAVDIPIGTKFGLLTVLGRASIHPDRKAYWLCKCECGKEVEVSSQNLRSGQTKSCGDNCHRSKIQPNQRFGKLTALKYVGHRDNGGSIWLCRCDCGKEIEVRSDSLVTGNTKSCGCLISYAEFQIENLLKQYNLPYKSQYTFSNLKGFNGGTLRFDFGILNKKGKLFCLIEYQGIQHYDASCPWYNEEAIARDNLKVEYCKNHNIPLYIWNKETDLEKEISTIETRAREEE